jgi:hypothetical protein
MRQAIDAAEQALSDPDAWNGLTGYIRAAVEQGSGALAPLAGAIDTTPEMWRTSRRGRELLAELTRKTQAQGALRPDVTALDIAWLIEMFGRMRPVSPESEEHRVRQRLLAIAMDGLRTGSASRWARGATPLPGEPPTAEHYEGRWGRSLRVRAGHRVKHRCQHLEIVCAQRGKRTRVFGQATPEVRALLFALRREGKCPDAPVVRIGAAFDEGTTFKAIDQRAEVGSVVVEPRGESAHRYRVARLHEQEDPDLRGRQADSRRVARPQLTEAVRDRQQPEAGVEREP